MRGPSLLLRVLVLAVLLPVTAAVCIVILIGSGALHPRLSHMVAAGGAILIIATLAAALSTFSPKFRPTPLLTPLLAGVFAALLATAGLYGAQAYIATKHQRPIAATAEAKPIVVPVKPAADNKASQDKAPVEPDPRMAVPQPVPTEAPQPTPVSAPAAAPPPAAAPNFDNSAFAPADALSTQPAAAGPSAAPSPRAADTAKPQPVAATPPAAPAPPATADAAAPTDQSANADSTQAKKGKPAAGDDASTVTIANIPVPAAAPTEALPNETATPDPNAPMNLNPWFDPSGPSEPKADGPPMALAGGGGVTATHRSAIPPLPRIRPCGGAGPACP